MLKFCLIIKNTAVVCICSTLLSHRYFISRNIAKASARYHRISFRSFYFPYYCKKRALQRQLYIRIFNCSLVYSISQTAAVCISKGKGIDFQPKTSQLASLTHEFDWGKSREGVR